MILKKLALENFRNFGPPSPRLRRGKEKKFVFAPETNLILGPNTSGKTSVLEAIYFLASGGSFRAEKSEEVIKFGSELARVRGGIKDERLITGGPSSRTKFATGQGTEEKSLLDSVNSGLKSSLKNTSNSASQKAQKRGMALASGSSVIGEASEVMELEVILTRGLINGRQVPKKRYLVNGVVRRITNFLGNFLAVLFRPEDIDLMIGSPTRRRDYLDEVLIQVDKEYKRSLVSYRKGLRSRNKLLEKAREEPQFRRVLPSQLYFWNKLLIKNGQFLTQKREEYLEFLNSSLREKADLQVEYQNNVISLQRLEEWREKEILIGMTMIGPQRDDFVIRDTGYGIRDTGYGIRDTGYGIRDTGYEIRDTQDERRDLSVYGSRGEQRIAVLYLKMAQLEYIKEKTREKPVLLLDDIFAELDSDFREEVMKLIDSQQTVVTGIGAENIRIKGAELIKLK